MAGEFVRGGGVREREEATRRAWTRSCVAQGRRNIGDDLCPPTAGSSLSRIRRSQAVGDFHRLREMTPECHFCLIDIIRPHSAPLLGMG